MTLRTWLTFIALCVIWGFPYFLVKLALVDLSPACIAWGRETLGALVILPIAWRRGTLPHVLRHKRALIAFALAEFVVPFTMIAYGERWLSSSLAGILVAAVPLTIVCIAPLFGVHEQLTWRRLFGLVVGFIGVVVLLGIDTLHTAQEWLGVACLFAAVLGYAIGPLIVQRHLLGVDEMGSLAVSLSVASIVLLPVALMTWPTAMPSPLALTSVVILGVICTALAMLLYLYLIHAAGAARSSVVSYINPAIATLLGVLMLNEPFSIGMIAGLGLILFGSWLGTGGVKHTH